MPYMLVGHANTDVHTSLAMQLVLLGYQLARYNGTPGCCCIGSLGHFHMQLMGEYHLAVAATADHGLTVHKIPHSMSVVPCCPGNFNLPCHIAAPLCSNTGIPCHKLLTSRCPWTGRSLLPPLGLLLRFFLLSTMRAHISCL